MYFDPMQRRGPMQLQGPRTSYEGNPYGRDAGGGPGMFPFPQQMQAGGGLPMQPMQPRPMQTGGPGQQFPQFPMQTGGALPPMQQFPRLGNPGLPPGVPMPPGGAIAQPRTGGVMPPHLQQMNPLARMYFGAMR